MRFLIYVFFLFQMGLVFSQGKDRFVVVLDAGHGGHDSGNRGNGYYEKNIVLKVVLELGSALEKEKDFKVVYTREKDEFIALHQRGKIANSSEADLFVSIHCNAHKSKAHGTESFVLGLHASSENFAVAKNENSVILLEEDYQKNYKGFDPNSPESIIGLTLLQEEYLEQSLSLASMLENRFENTLKKKSRGVKQAGFVVLHQTYMPSVLIELGFLTNKKEGRYLNSRKGQKQMASAIKKSILEYKKSLEEIYVEPKAPIELDQLDTIKVEDSLSKNVHFKVQIAAGSKSIPLEPKNFNGLTPVSKLRINGLYKYYYGHTTSYEICKELRSIARQKGYHSSFIVAFKDEQPISVDQARKHQKKIH